MCDACVAVQTYPYCRVLDHHQTASQLAVCIEDPPLRMVGVEILIHLELM